MRSPSLMPVRKTRAAAMPAVLLAMTVLAAGCERHEPAATAPAAPAPEAPAVLEPQAHSGAAVPATEGALCALDAVNQTPPTATKVASGQVATLFGWAAAPGPVAPPAGTLVVLAGPAASYAVPLSPNVTRDDVASVFSAPALSGSGFNLDIATGPLAPGSYAVHVLFPGEPATGCDTKQSLVIE